MTMMNKSVSVIKTGNVHHTPRLPIKIKEVENLYNCKYVGEFSLPAKEGGWVNMPVAIFYQDEAHPQGSNWMAVFMRYDHYSDKNKLYVADGKPAVDVEWDGILTPEGDIIYSAYRHDMQLDSTGRYSIDGGREYTKISYPSEGNKSIPVKLKIEKDSIVAYVNP